MNLTQSAAPQRPAGPRRHRHDLRRPHVSPGQSRRTASLAWPRGCTQIGVASGDRVAILSLNSDRYHEYLLATWWAGGVVNPVNFRWSAQPRSPTAWRTPARRCCSSTTCSCPSFRRCRPLPRRSRPSCTAATVRRPKGCLAYEALLAHGTAAGRHARRGRPRRDLLHRRHDRLPQGRHAQPRQPAHLQPRQLRYRALRAVPGGRLLHAAPMFHLADLAAWMRAQPARRQPRHRSLLHPGRRP